MGEHRDNRPNRVDWADVDAYLLYQFIQMMCEKNAVVSLMFGEYGKYLKISWSVDGQKGMISDYDSKRFEAKLRRLMGEG